MLGARIAAVGCTLDRPRVIATPPPKLAVLQGYIKSLISQTKDIQYCKGGRIP